MFPTREIVEGELYVSGQVEIVDTRQYVVYEIDMNNSSYVFKYVFQVGEKGRHGSGLGHYDRTSLLCINVYHDICRNHPCGDLLKWNPTTPHISQNETDLFHKHILLWRGISNRKREGGKLQVRFPQVNGRFEESNHRLVHQGVVLCM